MTGRSRVLAALLTSGLVGCSGGGSQAPIAPTTPGSTRIISLSGTLTFGSVAVGQSSDLTLTITNTGNSTLRVTGVTGLSGFSSSWTSGTIAAGSSQAATIRFSPTIPQAYSGAITVNGDQTAGTNTIAVTGTGAEPALTRIIGLSGSLAFGSVTVGSSATTTLTIRNSGNAPLTWTGLSTGTGVVTATPTTGTIAAGSMDGVILTFAPTAAQAYSGTVTVTSNATAGTGSIGFSGTGNVAGLACGVERWTVKTLADTDAPRVNFSAETTTIQALNALPTHCSGIPSARTYTPEFQVYEVTGRIIVARSEDDRDYHIALSDPSNANSTIVTESADVACSGAATSPFRDALSSARSQFESFRGGRSLASLTGSLVTVRGVGFYDFNHGQTGRSQSCIELHPLTSFSASSSREFLGTVAPAALPSLFANPWQPVSLWPTDVSMARGLVRQATRFIASTETQIETDEGAAQADEPSELRLSPYRPSPIARPSIVRRVLSALRRFGAQASSAFSAR